MRRQQQQYCNKRWSWLSFLPKGNLGKVMQLLGDKGVGAATILNHGEQFRTLPLSCFDISKFPPENICSYKLGTRENIGLWGLYLNLETIYSFFIAETWLNYHLLALPVSAQPMRSFQYNKLVRNIWQKILSKNQEYFKQINNCIQSQRYIQ